MEIIANGVDYSYNRPSVDAIIASGVDFVASYISTHEHPKNFTKQECTLFSLAGINLVTIFQRGKSDILGGYWKGLENGLSARLQAESLGQPHDTWIYFAIGDYDVPESDYNIGRAFLEGVVDGLEGKYILCGYGQRQFVETMLNEHRIHAMFQSYGYSRPKGEISPQATLYQKPGPYIIIDAKQCDDDIALQPYYGQWRPQPNGQRMVDVEAWLLQMLGQSGDRYVFGAEADPLDPDPTEFDCSELGQWAGDSLDVLPSIPDGAYNQWRQTVNSHNVLTVEQGLRTRGAALFVGDGTGAGRDAITHVAYSLGNGLTIEARGTKWGVGTWPGKGRFQFAGLFPGINYTQKVDDIMRFPTVGYLEIETNMEGHGFINVPMNFDDMISVSEVSDGDGGNVVIKSGWCSNPMMPGCVVNIDVEQNAAGQTVGIVVGHK